MEENKPKSTLFSKLNRIRVKLQKMNLKKSGYNAYSKFKYYELQDFLPHINELNLEESICSIFNIIDNMASLKIIDIESKEAFDFSIPFANADIKGANAVQQLGGSITYLRRYLYMIAYEIIENDISDAMLGSTVSRDASNITKSHNLRKTSDFAESKVILQDAYQDEVGGRHGAHAKIESQDDIPDVFTNEKNQNKVMAGVKIDYSDSDSRAKIKAHGFKWHQATKSWVREVSELEFKTLSDQGYSIKKVD